MAYSFTRQLRLILLIEFLIFANIFALVAKFWRGFCGQDLTVCLTHFHFSANSFLLLSLIRPFLLTPLDVLAAMAGNTFGPYWGTFLTALGAVFSCTVIFGISRLVGKRFIRPWLAANLPMTFKFMQSQDWKLILATRFIPFFPYDLLSLLYGIFNFNWRYVIPLSFLASLPEIFIFAEIASPTTTVPGAVAKTLTVVCLFFLSPGVILEYISRKKGSGMWVRLKEMWSEFVFEVRMTNTVIRERTHDPKKIPVFLVYGFFSSRKTLTVLGHLLERRGYEVITFNLGGLFGVFSTTGIPESAESINAKLRRYIRNHDINQLNIIAHSKGGLVALWWLLQLGGHQYCNKLITLGTPFEGTYLTWLGLASPLGGLMRDMWQMRPGSDFLHALKTMAVPEHLRIYNLYSDNDSVARGERGIFKSVAYKQIQPIAMHHVYHEDFLKRRDVCDTLAYILGSPYIPGVQIKKSKPKVADKEKKAS